MSAHRLALLLIAASSVAAAPSVRRGPTTLKDHEGWVGAVAFARDGRFLASAGADRKVRLAGRPNVFVPDPLTGHTDAVCALAFAPRGDSLATASFDGTARVWDVSTVKEWGRGREKFTFHIYLDPRHTLRGHRGVVMAVAFSPDGKTLATGGMDTTIRLWDVATGKQKHLLAGHKSWVNGLTFSTNGKLLASASSDATVKLWDVRTRKVLITLPVKSGEVRCVALSPDGKTVAAGVRYGLLKVWDLGTRKEKASLKAHDGETWAVTFSPGGKTLISGGGDWNKPGEVKLWDASTWKPKRTLKHTGEVLCVAVSADGEGLAAGSWDKTVRVWDVTELLRGER
jgi:WD40 repeat protein